MFSSTALLRAYRSILFPWKQNLLAHLVFFGEGGLLFCKGKWNIIFGKKSSLNFRLYFPQFFNSLKHLSYQLLFVLQKDRVRNSRKASFVPAAFCFAKRQGPKYNTQSPFAFVAQSVERSLGKTEVSGSIPDEGSVFGAALRASKMKPRYSSGQRG